MKPKIQLLTIMKKCVITIMVFALMFSSFATLQPLKKEVEAADASIGIVYNPTHYSNYIYYEDTTMNAGTRQYPVEYKVSGNKTDGYNLYLYLPTLYYNGMSTNVTRTLINDVMVAAKDDNWTKNNLKTLTVTGFQYVSSLFDCETVNIVVANGACTLREGLNESNASSLNSTFTTMNVSGSGTMTFNSKAFYYKGKDTNLYIDIDNLTVKFQSCWAISGGYPDSSGSNNCNNCYVKSSGLYANAPAGHKPYINGVSTNAYTNALSNAWTPVQSSMNSSSVLGKDRNSIKTTSVSMVYLPNIHTVTFSSGNPSWGFSYDGVNFTSAHSVQVAYGQGIPYPGAFSRYGYNAVSWSSSLGGYNPSTMPDADIQLTLNWSPVQVAVYVHPNGGAFTDGTTDWKGIAALFDSTVTLPTPVRTGYAFDTWILDGARYGGSTYTCNQTVDPKYFTAFWNANSYSITLDANGGSLETGATSVGVTYDSVIPGLPTPTRAGYTFAGWWTAASGGTQIVPGSTLYQTAGNSTFYAHWVATKYKITFNAEGGVMPSGVSNSISVTHGSQYPALPIPTRTGYTFLGWRLANNSYIKQGNTVTVTSDQTAYATWQANRYKVTFNANGGTIADGTTNKAVVFAQQYGELPQPTRDNYIFNGWTTESGMAVDSRSVCIIDGDHTLVANWLQETAQVVLNPNGGTCATIKFTAYNGKPYGELPTPTRKSYIFLGWFTQLEGGEQITKDTVAYLAGDITLYAHWSAQKYKVSFDPAGGTCDTPSIEVVYMGKYQNLPVAVRPGYKFEGWYTSLTNWEEIEEGATVNIMEDITLYAHWSKETYVISFDGNGGKAGQPSKSVLFDSTYGTLPTAKWKLHKFKGWYTAPTGGTKITAKSKVTITENTTLYAQWKAEPIELILNGNGGKIGKTKTKTMTVAYDEVYGKLPSPKRKGYKFKGWYTKKSGGKKVTEKSYCMETGKHTLYAHWTKVKTAKASIKKLTPKTKTLVVQWKKVKGANGYEVSYSTSKKFTKKTTKTKTIKNNKTFKLTIKKLKAKKKYYVRIRAFKYDSYGKKVYGKWSKIKKIKVK